MKRLVFGIGYSLLAVALAVVGGYLVMAYVVAKSPEVMVPPVTGMTLSEALDLLGREGLDLEVRGFVFHDTVEENRVVRQRPLPGQVIKQGRSVGLILSRGPERHPVPSVAGQLIEDASIALAQAGLSPEIAAQVHAPQAGLVMGQGLVPGRRAAKGAVVPLVVSDGPAPVTVRMPRLEGKKLAEAEALLERLGLPVERVEEISLGDAARAGRVVSQEPLPGFPVTRGFGVNLSVADSGASPSRTRAVWLERYFPAGFADRQVEVVVARGKDRRTAWAEKVAPGTTFRKLVTLEPGERVLLLVDGTAQ